MEHKTKALTDEEVEQGRSKAYEYLDLSKITENDNNSRFNNIKRLFCTKP